MSFDNATPAAAARKPRRVDPCASLRRVTAGEQRAADNREHARIQRDGVLAYMKERGLFDGYEYDSAEVRCDKLPWNPEAPPRAVAVELYTNGCETTYRGRPYFHRRGRTHVATIPVPNWDYEGVDPLVAREPWERAEAERELDHDAEARRSNWEAKAALNRIADEWGACIALNEGRVRPDDATFPLPYSWPF